MDDYTAEEIRDALAPLESLLSKSEKAQQKLAPGTWQHNMLEANIRALRIALPLLDEAANKSSSEDLVAARATLDSMIERVANTQTKFAPGTSQHSLQRNRLKALEIARSAVKAKLAEDAQGESL